MPWTDEDKLQWLKVLLTDRAQTAFKHLPIASKDSFELATAALKERYEPATRKHRYGRAADKEEAVGRELGGFR